MKKFLALLLAAMMALSFVTMCFVHHGDSKPAPKKGLEVLDVDD